MMSNFHVHMTIFVYHQFLFQFWKERILSYLPDSTRRLCGGSKTQVTGQVRLQVRSQVRLQVRSQVKSIGRIFFCQGNCMTIFNSKLTRYEKECVIMRGIVYFKLQDVALRD